MALQQGPEPVPAFRVRWKGFGGWNDWIEALDPPRVEEGCLVIKTSPTRLLWVPLHTITGMIEVEAV
jgi:hypothetical protein